MDRLRSLDMDLLSARTTAIRTYTPLMRGGRAIDPEDRAGPLVPAEYG